LNSGGTGKAIAAPTKVRRRLAIVTEGRIGSAMHSLRRRASRMGWRDEPGRGNYVLLTGPRSLYIKLNEVLFIEYRFDRYVSI
jgi:hypothetical protein